MDLCACEEVQAWSARPAGMFQDGRACLRFLLPYRMLRLQWLSCFYGRPSMFSFLIENIERWVKHLRFLRVLRRQLLRPLRVTPDGKLSWPWLPAARASSPQRPRTGCSEEAPVLPTLGGLPRLGALEAAGRCVPAPWLELPAGGAS